MLRTWPVRFRAMKFTESLRPFQAPETPSTRPWPPRIPSEPPSRATRVTSDAKERSWSTMTLTVSFNSRNSPLTSTVIFFVKSPFATAVVTVAMFRTCAVRLPAIRFTFSVRSFQVPATPFTFAWPPSLPSVLKPRIHPNSVVEATRDLPRHPRPVLRQPDREIAVFKCGERAEQLLFVQAVTAEAGSVGCRRRPRRWFLFGCRGLCRRPRRSRFLFYLHTLGDFEKSWRPNRAAGEGPMRKG